MGVGMARIDSDVFELEFHIPDKDLLLGCIGQAEMVVSNTLHNFIIRMANPCLSDASDDELQKLNKQFATRIAKAAERCVSPRSSSRSSERGTCSDGADELPSGYEGDVTAEGMSAEDIDESFDFTGMTVMSPLTFGNDYSSSEDAHVYSETSVPLPFPWNTVNFRAKSIALFGAEFGSMASSRVRKARGLGRSLQPCVAVSLGVGCLAASC